MEATIHHSGLSNEERALLAEFNGLREAIKLAPEGSAIRGELDKRLAIVEIKLGI